MLLNKRTFFTADTHFWHANIIRYCNRPWHSGRNRDGELVVTDADSERMTEALVKNWNSVVGKHDVVFHLGDFALFRKNGSGVKKARELLGRLNGRKHLVMGNHDMDISQNVDFWRDVGFSRVFDVPVVLNRWFVLSHMPMEFWNPDSPYVNIHGHVHGNPDYRTFRTNAVCVCVERHGYAPIRFSDVVKGISEAETSMEIS